MNPYGMIKLKTEGLSSIIDKSYQFWILKIDQTFFKSYNVQKNRWNKNKLPEKYFTEILICKYLSTS